MHEHLATVLHQADVISDTQIKRVLEHAKQFNTSIEKSILKLKLLTAQELQEHTSLLFNLPSTSLCNIDLHYNDALLALVIKHQVLPFRETKNTLSLAITDPTKNTVENDFRFLTGLQVDCFVANYADLFHEIEQISQRNSSKDPHQKTTVDPLLIKLDNNEGAINDFLNNIVSEARKRKASDIHFEPYENSYRIRLRCDGILLNIANPPIKIAPRIASIIKIQAKLDITETRLPQDGRILLTLDDSKSVDIRVSTLPCLWGEKLVLRLLDHQLSTLDIDALGLNQIQKEHLLSALHKPQGMILITGPTGSGKTASLYAALNRLNSPHCNISTVEDPVEISLTGVNQVQINEKINLTFAKSLRTFLRQDPDIIMLGEIRDTETAAIAIKAAQTGHLVLSTLHTNSAIDTITRLINMGIAPYNISASVTLIIAQRLIRKLCPFCKTATHISSSISKIVGLPTNTEVFEANQSGCSQCNYGYLGRVGVFEVLPISNEIKSYIENESQTSQLAVIHESLARSSLKQSAISCLKQGVTSFTELQRVIDI